MGDTALTLNACQWAADLGHEVTVMAYKRYGEMIGLFESFHFMADEQFDMWSIYSDPSPATADALRPFDMIFAFRADPDGAFAAGLEKINPGAKVCPPLPPDGYSKAYPLFLIESMAGALGVAPPDHAPYVNPGAEWRPHPVGALTVFPGAGAGAKSWPFENFAEVIRRWRGPVRILLGPAERERGMVETFGALAGQRPGASVELELSFPKIAEVLSKTRVFLGADSGVTHLAAALRTPVVALFGPTDPAVWSPIGPWVDIIRDGTGEMTGITPDKVMEELVKA